MAKEFVVGVRIGGALESTFSTAFGNARKTITQLGQATDLVRQKHVALGAAMRQALADPTANVGRLNREYQALGRTLDQLKIKQAALANSMARGAVLQAERRELVGKIGGTVGAGVAAAAPVIGAGKVAADFQDQLRDIAITGEMTAAEEAKLGATIRRSAVKFNQLQESVGQGIQVLVAGGIQNAAELERFAPVLAKTATATRAGVDDLGSVLIAMKNNLDIQAQDSESALNILAKSGKLGQFEIRDMAKWLPSLAPMFQSLGVQGPKAVAEIGAALQVARMGAGSNDEAANNFRNFLGKMTAPDTLKDFNKAGIDLKSSLQNLIGKGLSPVQAMLQIVTTAIGKEGPAAAADLQTALKSKDEVERQMALARLQESTKLGALFQDMQVLNFLRPAMANMDKLKGIQGESLAAGQAAPGQGVIDTDFARRMETSNEQAKQLRVGLTELGITLGNAVLPAFNQTVQAVLPLAQEFAHFAEANPGVVRTVIMLGAGLIGARLGILGFRLALNLILSPINAVRTAVLLLSARWTLLRALFQLGNFAPMGALFTRIASAAMSLGSALMGGLATGLRLAGQAFMILGRALMLNPIGLAVTAIGVAAFMVYKHWDTVKSALMAGWNWLRSLGESFRQAGANLIEGLINGITSRVADARARIVEVGSTIRSSFTGLLGIHSPSTVFAGYGVNIAEGAAHGIERGASRPARAAGSLAARIAAAGAGTGGGGMAMAGGGGISIHYSPTVQVQGGGGNVGADVQNALNLSLADLERMIRRIMADRDRKAND